MGLRPWSAWTLLVVAIGSLHGAGQEPAPESSSISAADLRRDVFVLASDGMEGRLVGTLGNRQAGRFIEKRFEELGLTPIGADRSYLHRFDLVIPSLGVPNQFAVTVGDRRSEGSLGRDFYPERFSGTGQAEGYLVFAGFGISAPPLGHDDYGNADISNRVVMVLDHEPGEHDPESPFDGEVPSEHARSVRKALEAQQRGAVALLLVADLHNHSTPRSLQEGMRGAWRQEPLRVPRYQLGAWVDQVRIPVLRISVEQAERMLAGNGTAFDRLTRRAEASGGITPIARPDIVVQVAASIHRERRPEHNVVGLINGSDPVLRDEWIILCAHYDHEGITPQGIFNGADDDASGIAGLLEIAEAYALAGARGLYPRRSILLAAWNAEERGMLGAWAYTEEPLAPLDKTIAVINMDMIGRHEEVPENAGFRFRGLQPQTAESNANAVNLLGYSYSTDLRAAAEAANVDRLQLRFRYDDSRSNLLRRSDHWPFLFQGIPALFVHTGLHPDYHTQRDQPDRLDYDKMSRIVRLVHQLSWDLAQDASRPEYN